MYDCIYKCNLQINFKFVKGGVSMPCRLCRVFDTCVTYGLGEMATALN